MKTKSFKKITMGNYLKVSKFYVLILTIFWKKGGNYSREDTNKGNTVFGTPE